MYLSNFLLRKAGNKRVFLEKLFLKILQNTQENTCTIAPFSKKLRASDLEIYIKRDSSADVFL